MKWPSGENLPRTHAKPTFSEAWFYSRYGLEFGYGSDTEAVREAFPTTVLDLLVGVSSIAAMGERELYASMRHLVQGAAPTSLVRDVFMADIGADVEDSTIEAFVDAVDAAFA
jgi:hypothetical protein